MSARSFSVSNRLMATIAGFGLIIGACKSETPPASDTADSATPSATPSAAAAAPAPAPTTSSPPPAQDTAASPSSAAPPPDPATEGQGKPSGGKNAKESPAPKAAPNPAQEPAPAAAPAAAEEAPATGIEKPCLADSFKFSAVKAACAKGGVPKAKSLMKAWTNKAKEKGETYKCATCHDNQRTYTNKSNADADLRKLLDLIK